MSRSIDCVASTLNRATCSPVGALPVGASDFLGPRCLYSTQQSLACGRLTASWSREQIYFNSWSPFDRPLNLQNHAGYLVNNARLSLVVSCRSLFLCRGGFGGPATDGSLRRGLRGCLAASVSFATGGDSRRTGGASRSRAGIVGHNFFKSYGESGAVEIGGGGLFFYDVGWIAK